MKKQYSLTRDELLNEEKLKQIKRLEIDHELKQKQHEVALLAEKNNSQGIENSKKNLFKLPVGCHDPLFYCGRYLDHQAISF